MAETPSQPRRRWLPFLPWAVVLVAVAVPLGLVIQVLVSRLHTSEQSANGFFLRNVAEIKADKSDRLYFYGERQTDDLLKSIAGLKGLRRVDLTPCDVTLEGVKQLASFPDLTAATFYRLYLTDAWIDALQPCAQLEELTLGWLLRASANGNTDFTLGQRDSPISVSAVLALPHLKKLTIDCPGTSGLRQLEAATNLQRLALVGRPASADLDALRDKLPNCEITVLPNWK